MTGKRIGYVRVSTIEQNPDRQLENVPLDKKFIEYASARSTERPQLKALLDFVREDDILIVHSMDRLARNLMDLRKLVDHLTSKKVEVQFMKENLRFNGNDQAMSNLLLSMIGAFAEFEYAFIKERQLEGIAIAKKAGKYQGRPSKFKSLEQKIIIEMETRKPKAQIAKELGVSRYSLYNYLKKIKKGAR